MERYKSLFTEKVNPKDYIKKFKMKMNGSAPSTAMGWVDGIGNATDEEKLEIWNGIQDNINFKIQDVTWTFGKKAKWIP